LLLFWLVVEKPAVLPIMSTLIRMDANSHQTKVAGCMKTLHDCKFAGDKVWVQTCDLGKGREREREWLDFRVVFFYHLWLKCLPLVL
jgi:hypothetical protein